MLFQKEKNDSNQIDRLDQKRERRSPRRRYFLFPPIIRNLLSGKVSLCTFQNKLKKASLTVEAALVLPLFFFGAITLLSFMDIYKIQTEHLTKLCQNAKEAGMYAYGVGGSTTDNIILPDVYSYQPVGGLIPLPKIWFHNTVKVHAWTGTEFPDNGGEQGEIEQMVYVTASGSVYHKNPGCSYLNVSLKQIPGSSVRSASNQYGEHYSACETCSRGQNPAGVVYVTEQGNRYHNLESCSGLKRSVRLVKASSVSGMSACSRCG